MEEIRKHHNDAKRALIQSVTKEGYHILDVGSGVGGDLMKWKKSTRAFRPVCVTVSSLSTPHTGMSSTQAAG